MVAINENSWGSILILASGGIWWECPICHNLKCTNSIRPPPCLDCGVWMRRHFEWPLPSGLELLVDGLEVGGKILESVTFYRLSIRWSLGLTTWIIKSLGVVILCSYRAEVKMLSWVIDAYYFVNHWEITLVNAALLFNTQYHACFESRTWLVIRTECY